MRAVTKDGRYINMEHKTNSIVAAFIAVTSWIFQCFDVPLVIWFFVSMIDYISGSVAAIINNRWTRRQAVVGAITKIGMFLIIIMGILLDALATYMGKYANQMFTTKGVFGLAVTCWFIGTEGISALKNFKEWKVAIPPFLKKAFGKVKKSANTLGK